MAGLTSQKRQAPPLPNTPMPNVAVAAMQKSPQTGLTRTETALLSPSEQEIARKNMTPKTTREHIISLHGHVTGLKKDIANLKTNHLKHMCLDIKSLGGKIDQKSIGFLLATVGAVAFQLVNLLVKTI